MKILKVINNNVISSIDENGKEVVVMGSGIGFQKKPDDEIDETRIEKIFYLSKEHTGQFEELVANIPYEHVQLAKEIIQYAEDTLRVSLNKNIYITLTDHLNYAVERKKQGVYFENALLWEIKKFYQKEYQIGLKAIAMVRNKIGLELPEEEAGFLALHIVNAQLNGDLRQSMDTPGVIKDIINIVRYSSGVELDESSLSYERFVTHLKFFIQRGVKGEYYEVDDQEFYNSIKKSYSKEYNCALKIKDYMNHKMSFPVTNEEVIYLTVHISRVFRSGSEIVEKQ